MPHCHASAYGGLTSTDKTVAKILQVDLYWPNIFKDVHSFIKRCYWCEHIGNISKRNEMPINNILEVEIFDFWGIYFMGPYPSSMGNQFILIILDYVSKWIKVMSSQTNDARVVIRVFKKIIFPMFRVCKVVIIDGTIPFHLATI